MAHKKELRVLHTGTIKNTKSKLQETELDIAVKNTIIHLRTSMPTLRFGFISSMKNTEIIEHIKKHYPDEKMVCNFDTTSIRPDGGFIYILDSKDNKYYILISEKKNQGTNDVRLVEGKKKQSQGNAIERLGKNVIGIRALMSNEDITPFVCFGDGCDFNTSSTILDRVSTIANYKQLNKTHLTKTDFDSGSFYFRESVWTIGEMELIMIDIAERSILNYKSKYGLTFFG